MSKTNPNRELTAQEITKIKRKNKWLLIIGSFILACSIAGLVCVIYFLK